MGQVSVYVGVYGPGQPRGEPAGSQPALRLGGAKLFGDPPVVSFGLTGGLVMSRLGRRFAQAHYEPTATILLGRHVLEVPPACRAVCEGFAFQKGSEFAETGADGVGALAHVSCYRNVADGVIRPDAQQPPVGRLEVGRAQVTYGEDAPAQVVGTHKRQG